MCALRGHDVILFEKTDKLGGVFNAAAAPDFKESDKKLIEWYIKQVTDLNNIEIKMNTEATLEDIKEINPDNVYVIGDADYVGNLLNVIWKAYEVASEI